MNSVALLVKNNTNLSIDSLRCEPTAFSVVTDYCIMFDLFAFCSDGFY